MATEINDHNIMQQYNEQDLLKISLNIVKGEIMNEQKKL